MSDNVKIYIDNIFTSLDNINEDLEKIIFELLSFEIDEAGDGTQIKRKHLYNRKNHMTYTGLLPHIIDILKEQNVGYEIIDKREKPEQNANFKIVEHIMDSKGNKIPIVARDYQEKIVNEMADREVVQVATGGGKTFIMASTIAKFNVKPVLVFADKLSLVQQIKEEFEKFLGTEVGIVGGGQKEIKDITVCSIQSVDEELAKSAKMIMFDECLAGDSLITLSDGTQKTIQEIVENKLDVDVVTYNTELKIFENKKIYDWRKIPLVEKNKKMVRLVIEQEDGTEKIIECTEDHKIWIESENKYIEAGKLIEGMEVVCNN